MSKRFLLVLVPIIIVAAVVGAIYIFKPAEAKLVGEWQYDDGSVMCFSSDGSGSLYNAGYTYGADAYISFSYTQDKNKLVIYTDAVGYSYGGVLECSFEIKGDYLTLSFSDGGEEYLCRSAA